MTESDVGDHKPAASPECSRLVGCHERCPRLSQTLDRFPARAEKAERESSACKAIIPCVFWAVIGDADIAASVTTLPTPLGAFSSSGTCFAEHVRPMPLQQKHVDAYRVRNNLNPLLRRV